MRELDWRKTVDHYGLTPWCVEMLGAFSYPTVEMIAEVAANNKFLLNNAEHAGEGVVCKAQGWRNKYGRQQYGKLVLDEFKQHQKNKKHRADIQAENLEKDIVNYFVTNAELTKAREKTAVYFGEDFRIEGKFIGYFLNEVWNALIDETPYMLKKYQMPTINYRVLNAECKNKARAFLDLI